MPRKKKRTNSDTNFSLMFQNKSLAQLGRLDGSDFQKNFNPELAKSTVELNGITVELTMASVLPFKASTHKLLDYAITLFTKNNESNSDTPDCAVQFSLDDYLDATGVEITKNTRDYLRKKLRSEFDVLYGLSIDCEAVDNTKGEFVAKERIISGYSIVNSEVVVNFNPAFAGNLTHSYYIDLPKKLFAIPEVNQAPYYIGKKLAEHATYYLNKTRGTDTIISVKTLLAACPVLPKVEDVPNSKYKERIQHPFVKAMDYLVESGIITYEFCNAKKEPLTERQKNNFNFDTFKNSYVFFKMVDAAE